MSRGADESDKLTSLLQALPAPEPSAEFLAGARRRYLEAVEARHRRAVFTGLTAAVVGLVVTASLLTIAIEPAALVVLLAEAAANLARWATGVGVVIALVPLSLWTSTLLASTAALLSVILVARARSLMPVK